MEADLSARLQSSGVIPAGSSASMGSGDAECRARIEAYLAQTEDPEIEGAVAGLVAPHLDYDRGWPNYAAAYCTLRTAEAPDRVVILGTNHYGMGDGVVLTEYGFESPMGRCPADCDVVQILAEGLGRPLLIDQVDHVAEHSIQLQLPWLQYFFGNLPVVAALIPDPLVPMVDGPGERVDGPTFVTSLRQALAEVGGRTLVVASSDLSHVGPQFGEPRAVDEQRRLDTERHDRDLLGHFVAGDAEEFLAAVRWTMNPTRWCSVGNMAALLRLVQPGRVELIDYRQSCDERGACLVSSAALAVVA
jgi:AmmeMemoRadiSam system protein B